MARSRYRCRESETWIVSGSASELVAYTITVYIDIEIDGHHRLDPRL